MFFSLFFLPRTSVFAGPARYEAGQATYYLPGNIIIHLRSYPPADRLSLSFYSLPQHTHMPCFFPLLVFIPSRSLSPHRVLISPSLPPSLPPSASSVRLKPHQRHCGRHSRHLYVHTPLRPHVATMDHR